MGMGRAGWPPASEGVRQVALALVVGALNGWTELDRAGRGDGGHRAPTAGPFSQRVAQSPPPQQLSWPTGQGRSSQREPVTHLRTRVGEKWPSLGPF